MHTSVQPESRSEGFKIFEKFRNENMFSKSLVNSDGSSSLVGEQSPTVGAKKLMASIGSGSASSSESQGKLASVSTAPTATVTSTMQKESLMVMKRKLSQGLDQINEDVHVEDACEDDLNDGRQTIRKQRLQAYTSTLQLQAS